VVAGTKVAVVVVAAIEVVAVAVTSLNWKFQSVSRQTQCPAIEACISTTVVPMNHY
jgi:hypothetical protein